MKKGQTMINRRQIRRGFTLVELLVVIAIIAMLSAFAAPKLMKTFFKAKRDLARPRIALIESALERFSINCGRYPDESEGLEALVAPPADLEEAGWSGPYLKMSQLVDPWDNPFVYIAEGEVNPGSYDLFSMAADGQEGGELDGEDIYND